MKRNQKCVHKPLGAVERISLLNREFAYLAIYRILTNEATNNKKLNQIYKKNVL